MEVLATMAMSLRAEFLDVFMVAFILICLANSHVHGLDNGMALTPPMGFANWNGFGCNYDDATFRQQADFLVSSGMRDAGYKTMIIQECITKAGNRDPNGVPMPDPKKFPYGIKGLCDYIHSKGLLCGIYTDVGTETCAGWEGSFNHEKVDAETYASWGIDFVEEDSCHHPQNFTYETLYGRMRDALNATGRPITFYSCVQGQENVDQWGTATANLWRTTGDICGPGHASWGGMIRNFYGNARYPNVTGPGHWQDPDMLVVAMPGLSELEWRTHFSLWAISAAPLWAGVDLTKISASALAIFTNKEVVAIDQDPLGIMGTCRNEGGVCGTPVGAHPAVNVIACDDANAWTMDVKLSTLVAPNAQVLTLQTCGSVVNDPAIMWEYVPDSCHGSSESNQLFHLVPRAQQQPHQQQQQQPPPPQQQQQQQQQQPSGGGGWFSIVANMSGLCLELSPSGVVQTNTCVLSPAQAWRFYTTPDNSPHHQNHNHSHNHDHDHDHDHNHNHNHEQRTANRDVSNSGTKIQHASDTSGQCLNGPGTQTSAVGEVWARPLKAATASHRVAVVMFNPTTSTINTTATFTQLGLRENAPVTVRDVWLHQDLTNITDHITVTLEAHGSEMFVVEQNQTNV